MAKKKYSVLECFDCHTLFHSKPSNLKRHLKLHNPKVIRVKCSQCNRSFQNLNNFKTHFKNVGSSCVPAGPEYIEDKPKVSRVVRAVDTSSKQNTVIKHVIKPFVDAAQSQEKVIFIRSSNNNADAPLFGSSDFVCSSSISIQNLQNQNALLHNRSTGAIDTFRNISMLIDLPEISNDRRRFLGTLNLSPKKQYINKRLPTNRTRMEDISLEINYADINFGKIFWNNEDENCRSRKCLSARRIKWIRSNQKQNQDQQD